MNPPQVYMCSPSDQPINLPPHTVPLSYPSAPAPSIWFHASNLDWQFISHMIIYKFQCHSKSSHPHPLPPSPKDCSIHLYLFCCLTYRVIVTTSATWKPVFQLYTVNNYRKATIHVQHLRK